ncbi:hypothetical protein A4H97_29440 [Niastella yeongjuensis]|uniref:Uncharacterized protein n=1 Tax=Niastella yeongjuensis TaxID=354355 RepID=A0A1V9ES88_9BACT|nr:hypothetical protein [Niastella yeongjuensis]OQP49009.1 hypothetical protein A4H97_29440 [Niastella yeongjuensis]SEP10262.1 hypothetical protein SAMN05660816_04386 [Niastella yeongjuensis]
MDKTNQTQKSNIVPINDDRPTVPIKPKKEEKHIVISIGTFLAILAIIGSSIAGAYAFGKEIGYNKFDSEKNSMHDSLNVLNQQLKKANTRFADYKDSLENDEVIKQIDEAVTHQAIPAWEKLKKNLHKKHEY